MNGSFRPHGHGRNRRRNACAWALAGAVAVLGGFMLAACGTVPPGPGHASSGPTPGTSGDTTAARPALCREAATLTSMVVTRDDTKVRELLPAFPRQVTVTNPAEVRAVARALCALPDMPRGVFNCPALLLGTTYTLHFAVDGRSLPLVTVNSTGCETVLGVGPARRVTSSKLWGVLSTAIGVKVPPPVLSGDAPGAPCQPVSTGTTEINGCPGVARPGTGVVAPGAPAS
jgi:hypothetical protein